TRIVEARNGIMALRDGMTGLPVGASNGVIPLAMGKFGTCPDWSPDGSNVIFAQSATNKTRNINAGSIARVPYNGGAWGTVDALVASTGMNDNNYYPMYSFDARYIAFVKATMGGSDNNNTARLYMLPGGGGTPVQLVNANQMVSNADLGATVQLSNSMPTWA